LSNLRRWLSLCAWRWYSSLAGVAHDGQAEPLGYRLAWVLPEQDAACVGFGYVQG